MSATCGSDGTDHIVGVHTGLIETNPVSDRYIVNFTCEWVITVPDVSATLLLELIHIDITPTAVMQLHDGGDVLSPTLLDISSKYSDAVSLCVSALRLRGLTWCCRRMRIV